MRTAPSVVLLLGLISGPAFSATPRSIPSDLKGLASQAEQARASDRLNAAIALYQKGLRRVPGWTEGWWSLGTIFYDQDRFSEAQQAFEHSVALSPKPGPAYGFLALCEYETRDYDHALQHFKMWASKGWTGNSQLIDVAVFHFALLLTREGSFLQAQYLLASEVEKSYAGATLIEAMGLASLHMRNVPEDYPSEQREAVWLAGKAAFYAAVYPVDFNRADEYARRLTMHYGETPNVHYFLGTLRKFESDDAAATAEFERELQVSPKHAGAMVELARLAADNNQEDKALSLVKNASQLEPKNPEAHRIWGALLMKSGNLAESIRELEAAKRLAPDSAPIRFQLAAAYRKVRRQRDAEREMAAFNLLKDKQQVMASPQEKLGNNPELLK